MLEGSLPLDLAMRNTQTIQICGDLLCILNNALFEEKMEQLTLWDWRNGELKFVRPMYLSMALTCHSSF